MERALDVALVVVAVGLHEPPSRLQRLSSARCYSENEYKVSNFKFFTEPCRLH
jgi:hypothetical protein